MTIRLFISRDAAAIAVGADQVAAALKRIAAHEGRAIEIVRTGSRGMLWLEPLVEVEVAGVRYGFGPIEPDDVGGLLIAGNPEQYPFSLPQAPAEFRIELG
jgi:formate dehydrogenase iron-sulfur subunit